MSTTMERIRNGVDTETLFATLDAVKAQPELGAFQFRVSNRWIDGAHNRSTIKDFYAAGGEDTSRATAFELDAGEPAILIGNDTGPNPAETAAPRAGSLPDDLARLRRLGARHSADQGRVEARGLHGRAWRARPLG